MRKNDLLDSDLYNIGIKSKADQDEYEREEKHRKRLNRALKKKEVLLDAKINPIMDNAKNGEIFVFELSQIDDLNVFFKEFRFNGDYFNFLTFLIGKSQSPTYYNEYDKSKIDDVFDIEGTISNDIALLILKNIYEPFFKNRKREIKILEGFLCDPLKHPIYSLFVYKFDLKKNAEYNDNFTGRLTKIKVPTEIVPFYLFISYLQRENAIGDGTDALLFNRRNIKMKKDNAMFLIGSSIKFIDFLDDHKSDLNYPLNLFLLNAFINIPDIIYFYSNPQFMAINKNKNLIERLSSKSELNIDFLNEKFEAKEVNVIGNNEYLFKFTKIQAMLSKWYLYSLKLDATSEIMADENIEIFSMMINDAADEIYENISKDKDKFTVYYRQLCNSTRKIDIPTEINISENYSNKDSFNAEVEKLYYIIRDLNK